MLTLVTICFLVLFFILWNTLVVVPMREMFVVERLGRFKKIMKPGLNFMIPFFDRASYKQDMREQVLDIPSQTCITKDNIQVDVDGLVYLKVMDAGKASYGIANYRKASVNLAQTTMRSEVGKLSLGETFSERETLNETIVKEIDKASDSWGIKVLRYEIRNILPSHDVVHTLEKQMEAVREKRAEITFAEAEKQSMINISEGERQEMINLSEGEKQKRINEAIGRAKEIEIVAEATAEGVTAVAEAIRTPGGALVMKMQLLEKFVEELGEIMEKSNLSVMPNEMANIKGMFEGFTQVSDIMSKNLNQ